MLRPSGEKTTGIVGAGWPPILSARRCSSRTFHRRRVASWAVEAIVGMLTPVLAWLGVQLLSHCKCCQTLKERLDCSGDEDDEGRG